MQPDSGLAPGASSVLSGSESLRLIAHHDLADGVRINSGIRRFSQATKRQLARQNTFVADDGLPGIGEMGSRLVTKVARVHRDS